MSKLNIHTMVAALCGSVLLTACPGDDTTGTGTETESSSSSSTGPVVTTVPTTMTMTTDQTTTTGVDTTVGVDDTSTSTGPGVTTTTGEDATTTTGESTTTGEPTTTGATTTGEPTTTGESSGSTTGGPPPMDGYGDCANNDPMVVCQMDEACLGVPEGDAACSEQDCADAGDCPVPTSGDAVPACMNITGMDGINDCYLDCAGGAICPDGMTCYMDFLCFWPFMAPMGLCPDQDLGNTVPQSTMGDNTGLVDDWVTSCGDGGGEDAMYQFTAPAAGSYTFDTAGTAFDTILTVLDDCAGPELDCNDDVGMGDTTSIVTVDLAAGQTVIIVVEGYGAATGAFILNIS